MTPSHNTLPLYVVCKNGHVFKIRCYNRLANSGVFNIALYLQKSYRESIISDKTAGVQHIGMIVIILVKGAAKCRFTPVHCAVILIDFFGYLCYDMGVYTANTATSAQTFCHTLTETAHERCPT